jgi:arabinofuranan 3-O-arabinosyltransferase
MQLRDFDFGLVHYNYSFVLGKKERPVGLGAEDGDVASGLSRGGPRPREIAPELPDWAKTTRRFEGVASITASSYSSWLVQLPELRPYAAFDRDLRTAWVTGAPGRSSGEWIEIRFDSPLEPDRVQITPLLDHPFRPLVRTIRIDTDAGSRLAELSPVETPQWIEAPKGPTSRMRVTLVDVEGEANAGFSGAGLREIAIPGVVVTERLEAPRSDQVRAQAFPDPGSGSEEQRTDMASRGDQVQLFVFERNRVHPALVGRQDEEPLMHRAFRLDRSGTYAIEGTVVPVPGASLDELIKIEGPVTIAASSQFNGLPEFRASNLLDGDTSTIWGAAMPRPIPNPLGIWAGPKAWTPFRTPVPVIEGLAPAPDPVPHIVLQMQRELSLSRMRLVPAERGPVSSPARVRIVSEYGNREAEVDGAGWASFEPLYGRTFRIEFPATRERISIDSMTGISTPLPVGFAELEIPELSGTQYSVPLPRDPFELPCGQGPNIVVDGHVVETAVKGTIEDLVFMRPLRLEGCTVFELSAGDRDHTLDEVRAAAPFSLEKVVLAPASLTGSLRDKSDAGPVSIERWGNRERKVRVGPGPARLLVINENFNGGWSAYLGRESLPAIRVDGWKQGFLVPAGAGGTVRLLYRPGYIHSAAITAGLVVLAILLWEAMVGSSRRHGDPAVGRCFARSSRVSGRKGLLDKLPRFGRIPDSIRAATLVVSVTGAVGLLSRPAMPLSAVLATLVAFGPQRLRRPFRRLLPPLAGVAYAAATIWVSLEVPAVPADHKGPFGVGPQVLSAAAVLLIAIALGSRVWHPSRKRS